MNYLAPQLAELWKDKDPFQELADMPGKVFRELNGRRTFQFELGGRSYFAKLHTGVGWQEIIKNLLQGRLPVLGAENEWRAIRKLEQLEVATMTLAGYGQRGSNPASRQSFVITEALPDTTSLEDYCKPWIDTPPTFAEKRVLIEQLASIARTLHQAGVCHRDFYLCHFLRSATEVDQQGRPKLYLIDLHRVLIKPRLSRRWIVKDIAGLYYSAMNTGLSLKDGLRFVRHYDQTDIRRAVTQRGSFWQAVESRAQAMYRKLGPAS